MPPCELCFSPTRACFRYTGPEFVKYNLTLRAKIKSSPPFMKSDFDTMCKGNSYSTTIHTINSLIVKVAKLTVVEPVYRGSANGVLPQPFWEQNAEGSRGGVDVRLVVPNSGLPVILIGLRFSLHLLSPSALALSFAHLSPVLHWTPHSLCHHQLCWLMLRVLSCQLQRIQMSPRATPEVPRQGAHQWSWKWSRAWWTVEPQSNGSRRCVGISPPSSMTPIHHLS